MPYCLIVTAEAKQEIYDLKSIDLDASIAAALLIQNLSTSQVELDDLCRDHTRSRFTPVFQSKEYVEAIRNGYNIYILKFKTIDGAQPKVRLLIGYHAQEGKYYVLQLQYRSDENYSIRSPEFRELARRYEQCGIPRYNT